MSDDHQCHLEIDGSEEYLEYESLPMADDHQCDLEIDGSDEYLEYGRNMGEVNEYKKNMLPQGMKNKLYTHLAGPSGRECKHMGPNRACFCQHRYQDHEQEFDTIPTQRPILLPCRVAKCKCESYKYVPPSCCQSIRCHCKHTSDEHQEFGKLLCKKAGCTQCTGFKSSFVCGCGALVSEHELLVETAEERQARKHRLGYAVVD